MTTKNANQGRASESLLHSLATELAAARAMPRPPKPASTAQPKPKRKLSVYQKAAVRRCKERHERAVQEFAQQVRPKVAPLVAAGLSYRRMAAVLNERGETYIGGRRFSDDTIRAVVKALGLR